VQEVVPIGEELPRALAIATHISAQAPLAVRATLAFARLATTAGWSAAQATAAGMQQALYNSEDAKEALRAFSDKRPPRFAGR
jgi:enoyl-CoA hydratase